MKWVDTLRTSLLLSLSLLVLFLLARRFKQMVMAKDLPAPLHAELLALQVLYHPVRLRMEVRLPHAETITPAQLNEAHARVHAWDAVPLEAGDHVLELPVDHATDGIHFFEMSTSSQRTVRKFELKQA
jgi:hypothetical protein